jgi:hypothetical protein
MLSPDKPKRLVSQAPLKDTTCHAGCGAVVQFRTNPCVYCAPCKTEKTRASARASMELQRRKRGVPKVKGTVIACASCCENVILNRNADTKFCRPCAVIENSKGSPARSAKKRATTEGRDYANSWQRQRRASDPAWGVSSHVRTLMHRALGKGKAGRSWREFVPYTLEELMAHLERQFLPGMSWANRGKWHIDHITPLASFTYSTPADPDFQAAWALTNLRPLWAVENVRKNATRTHLI